MENITINAIIDSITWPITSNIMTDPVQGNDGQTYERSAIIQALNIKEESSITHQPMKISDLKVKNPYNTYLYEGLPPEPISYVGKKTLDIVFENYKSDFLFYFYNKSLNRHVFSTNYKEHITKLNEYRKGK